MGALSLHDSAHNGDGVHRRHVGAARGSCRVDLVGGGALHIGGEVVGDEVGVVRRSQLLGRLGVQPQGGDERGADRTDDDAHDHRGDQQLRQREALVGGEVTADAGDHGSFLLTIAIVTTDEASGEGADTMICWSGSVAAPPHGAQDPETHSFTSMTVTVDNSALLWISAW